MLLYLKKSGIGKSGKAPIMGRITLGRSIAQFSCKLSCNPDLWNSRENDLTVNITKAKQMTNVRSATKDQTAVIKTPRILTLEESLEFLNDDEYMEVTPESIRLRKQILDKNQRAKAAKKKKSAE